MTASSENANNNNNNNNNSADGDDDQNNEGDIDNSASKTPLTNEKVDDDDEKEKKKNHDDDDRGETTTTATTTTTAASASSSSSSSSATTKTTNGETTATTTVMNGGGGGGGDSDIGGDTVPPPSMPLDPWAMPVDPWAPPTPTPTPTTPPIDSADAKTTTKKMTKKMTKTTTTTNNTNTTTTTATTTAETSPSSSSSSSSSPKGKPDDSSNKEKREQEQEENGHPKTEETTKKKEDDMKDEEKKDEGGGEKEKDEGQASVWEEKCRELEKRATELQAERDDALRRCHETERAKTREIETLLGVNGELQTRLNAIQETFATLQNEKSHLDDELVQLRKTRDEHERKEIVLSNRLNAAKKQEAVKANLAEQLERGVQALQDQLETTKYELQSAARAKTTLQNEMHSTRTSLEERANKSERALHEERKLNEDRKKKMKAFVEAKQEELRQARGQTEELNLELSQTSRSLRDHHGRWKQLHAQWVASQTRNRELQRELTRYQKESETQHKKGDQMEFQMAKRRQETEEHKHKRLTAKNELMTVLRTLEAERDLTSRLRESIKFTFTPKALSQQQLLRESLQDMERELERLSRRLGRPLPPAPDRPELFAIFTDDDDDDHNNDNGDDDKHSNNKAGGGKAHDDENDNSNNENDNENDDEGDKKNNNAAAAAKPSRSEIDTNHLLSHLESETQRVSQCIMALMNSIERMHIVVEGSGERTCTDVLNEIIAAASAPSAPPPMTTAAPTYSSSNHNHHEGRQTQGQGSNRHPTPSLSSSSSSSSSSPRQQSTMTTNGAQPAGATPRSHQSILGGRLRRYDQIPADG